MDRSTEIQKTGQVRDCARKVKEAISRGPVWSAGLVTEAVRGCLPHRVRCSNLASPLSLLKDFP